MTIREFEFLPTRWAALAVTSGTTQADVDALFVSVDTTYWTEAPRWDAGALVVRFQMVRPPYGQEVTYGVGSVIATERPYFRGALRPSQQAQVVGYQPGEWSDTVVTYL